MTSGTNLSPDEGGKEVDEDADRILQSIASSLNKRRGPRGFTHEAIAALLQRQAEFVEDVATESIRRARSEQQDAVSASHIAASDAILRSKSRDTASNVQNALGGVLGGAGASGLISVLSTQDPSLAGYLLSTTSTVVGAVLLALGLARRRR